MLIKPNKTQLEGKVHRVERAADGIGAEVEIEISSSKAAGGHQDFIGARPGARVKMFAAVPDELEAGKNYRLTASVLGGPGGERVVIEKVRAAKNTARSKSKSASKSGGIT